MFHDISIFSAAEAKQTTKPSVVKLFSNLFYLIGFMFLILPFYLLYQAKRTVYVLTDLRAIVFNQQLLSVQVNTYDSRSLSSLRRKQKNEVMKQDSHLTTFDGTNANTLFSDIRNFTVRDGWLYVLAENGRITRTENLTSWQFVSNAPSNGSSIEVSGNDVYVGTEDAKIYWDESVLDNLPKVTLAPIYLLLFDDKPSPPSPEN